MSDEPTIAWYSRIGVATQRLTIPTVVLFVAAAGTIYSCETPPGPAKPRHKNPLHPGFVEMLEGNDQLASAVSNGYGMRCHE